MADSTTSAAEGVAATAAPSVYPFPPGSVFTDGHPLPRLFVFDLDYTLWPFWVDTHVSAPIKLATKESASGLSGRRRQKAEKAGKAQKAAGPPGATPDFTPAAVVDRYGETFAFYGDVPHILQAVPAAGLQMGVASRTSAPDLARDMLALLRVPSGGGGSKRGLDVFSAGMEIYPTNKLRHMEALQKRTGIPYESFLFFDDESRNRNVETLGVTMYLVPDGTTWAAVERGVRAWRRRHGHSGGGTDGDKKSGKGGKKTASTKWGSDEDEDYEYGY